MDEQVALIQGLANFRQTDGTSYSGRWFVGNGYRITKGASLLHDYDTTANYAKGYATVTDGEKKVVLAYKQLSGWWAGGFELNPDGALSLCHMSAHRDSASRFAYYCHETREFLLSFGGSETGVEAETRLNYPVFALCDFDRYRKTGAFLNETRLASFSEMTQFLSQKAGVSNFRPANVREDASPLWGTGFSKIGPRREAASCGGGPSGNMMHADAAVLRALQTGWGGMWLLAETWVNGICDYPILHTRGFKSWAIDPVFNYALNIAGGPTVCNGISFDYKSFVEGEHPHWLSIIPWYYLTGDERVRENWETACNHRIHQRWEGKRNLLDATTTAPVGYERAYTYDVRDIAIVNWLLPRDSTEKAFLTFVMRNLIRPECSNTLLEKPGWDSYRGFWKVNGTNETDGYRWIHSFFAQEKQAENCGQILNVWPGLLPDSVSLRNKLRDRLLGLAYFNEVEQYVKRATGSYRVHYDYCIDSLQNDSSADYADDATYLQAFGYEQTGDTTFLNTGAHLYFPLYGATYCDEYFNKIPTLRFIYDYWRKDSVTVTYPELNVGNNGNGEYVLTWNEPVAGADQYILKYSEKQRLNQRKSSEI